MFKYFGKHYGTERYFIIAFLCMCIIISTISYSINLSNQAHKRTLDGTVVYTYDTIWSKTQNGIHVDSVYASADKTKIFVLLQNTMGLNSSMLQSHNAKDYQMFVTTMENGKFTKTPKVTFYSYGDTGFFGIYIVDTSGFNSEILSIILRSDTPASDMISVDDIWAGAPRDQSFMDHNQVRLYMNFGGHGMKTLTALDNEVVDPVTVYSQIKYAQTYETSTQNMWANKMEMMQGYLREIAQYRAELADLGVNINACPVPYYLANDRIDTIPNDFTKEPVVFDESMLHVSDNNGGFNQWDVLENEVEVSTNITSENTATGLTYEVMTGTGVVQKPYLYLHTDYIYPGGLNFEWQGVPYIQGLPTKLPEQFYNKNTSYLDAVNAYTEWSAEMQMTYSESSINNLMPKEIKYNGWRMMDGTYIDTEYVGQDYTKTSIATAIRKYETALNNYSLAKYDYQVTMFVAELQQQAYVRDIEKITTQNDKDVLYTY